MTHHDRPPHSDRADSVTAKDPPARRLTPARVTGAIGVALVVNLVLAWIGAMIGATMIACGQPVGATAITISTVVVMTVGAFMVALVARRRPGCRPSPLGQGSR